MNAANESSVPVTELPNTVAIAKGNSPRFEIKSSTVALILALKGICSLDEGSTLVPDREAVCEAVSIAREILARAEKTTDASGAWNECEAPKDRPIVAMGKLIVSDEFSTTAIPFCEAIEWREVNGHADWYLYFIDEYPMTLRRALDEEVIIHSWQEFPVAKTKVVEVMLKRRKYLKEVYTVTLEEIDGSWHLHICGLGDSHTSRLRFQAICKSLDEALEALADWRKGLIIV
jgi:hypothetical protein